MAIVQLTCRASTAAGFGVRWLTLAKSWKRPGFEPGEPKPDSAACSCATATLMSAKL